MSKIPLLPLLALALALALPGPARAAESYDNCVGFISSLPAVISTQGVWCMNKDLATAMASGEAVSIQANNVTLECNGFKLGGLAAGPATQVVGIRAANRLNTTIRGCNVRGFLVGTWLTGGGHVVEHNSFEGNIQIGVQMGGDGNHVRDNRIRDTGQGLQTTTVYGISVDGSTDVRDNHIEGVIAGGSTNSHVVGIGMVDARAVVVSGNTLRELVSDGTGSTYGIHLNASGRVLLQENRLVQPVNIDGSFAFTCDLQGGSLRNNTVWGYSNAAQGCYDDGGNVYR